MGSTGNSKQSNLKIFKSCSNNNGLTFLEKSLGSDIEHIPLIASSAIQQSLFIDAANKLLCVQI